MSALRKRSERGIVLVLVLIIGTLLTTVIAGLARRSVVDAHIARNRDAVAQAEALARGGVRIGMAILVADALSGGGASGDAEDGSEDDAAPDDAERLALVDQLADLRLPTPDGGELRLKIHEEGTRLNLNALIDYADESASVSDEAIEFLREFLAKVIDEMPLPPGERALYGDPRELAHNLLDYVDRDDVRQRGGAEDNYYQAQQPPYRAPNEPLLTVDELGMVEGFDTQLVSAIKPYVTVHPMAGGSGINLNTAPSHVLAAVYHGGGIDKQLASEDTVRRILRARQDGQILCTEAGADDRCILASEIVEGSRFPESSLPARTEIFTVVSEANVGEIRRSIEAVIDRREIARPQVLAWRMH